MALHPRRLSPGRAVEVTKSREEPRKANLPPRRKAREDRGAVDLLEEAVHLVRAGFPGPLFTYYLGSVPFLLGLLYFWTSMSRGAPPLHGGAPQAFVLALLFVWMKTCQAFYALELTALKEDRPPPRKSLGNLARTAAGQTVVQPWGWAMIPLAALAALPLGWVFAYYQNATVLGARGEPLKAMKGKARRLAFSQPVENHLLLSVFLLIGFFLFLNVCATLFLLPHLLKMLLGVETLFTRGGLGFLNTTFFAAAFAATHLVLDPLVKAAYTLRCFYGEASSTGSDLTASLRRLTREARATASSLAVFCLLIGGILLSPAAVSAEAPKPSPEDLDRSIEEVLKGEEYQWRSQGSPDGESLLDEFFTSVGKTLSRWLAPVRQWAEDFIHWLDRALTPSSAPASGGSGVRWPRWVKGLTLTLALAAVLALTVFLARLLRRRSSPQPSPSPSRSSDPIRLEDETISPDSLPPDRWASLAEELLARGDSRGALRALFLGTLALLSRRGWVLVSHFKTNGDYLREMERRSGEHPRAVRAFRENSRFFDRVWYGAHEATAGEIEKFLAGRAEMEAALEK